jgi:hypothetical protein
MAKKIMIVADLKSGNLYWTGKQWSEEYPDSIDWWQTRYTLDTENK